MGVRKKAKIALEVFLFAVFFLFVLLSFKSVRKGIESDKSGNYRNPSEVFNPGKVRSLSQATKILDELNASDHPESTPSKIDGYMYNRYVIDAFDVHMVVKENNEMEITENIKFVLNEPLHGIYRTLPRKNHLYRQDGTDDKMLARVKDVEADDLYDVREWNDSYQILIGDPSIWIKGEKTYTIKYTYQLGPDPLEGKDELYFNLLGPYWETWIGNISFTIDMPKDFDASSLGFTAGWERTADDTGVTWTVDGRTIKGSYDRILKGGQALTVRLELPEGYFTGAGFIDIRPSHLVWYGIPLLFLVISILLWVKYGRDHIVVDTVEFYPPEGLNSLDVGFLYKGYATERDVSSLLVYLASKGYLKIEDTVEGKGIFKKKSFKITRLRDYDGNNPEEKAFYNGLFEKHPDEKTEGPQQNVPAGLMKMVTSGMLCNHFYRTTDTIMLHMLEKEEKLFEAYASKSAKWILRMIVLAALCIGIPGLTSYELRLRMGFGTSPNIGGLNWIVMVLAFVYGCHFFLKEILAGREYGGANMKIREESLLHNVRAIIGLAFALFIFVAILLPLLYPEPIRLVGFLIGFACIAGMTICRLFLPKRSEYGTEMLGKVEGFRNFLQVAEKDQLERLMRENPSYCYDILPYAYVLGLSGAWLRKFEAMNIRTPEWFTGDGYDFDFSSHDWMDHVMETSHRTATTRPDMGGFWSGSNGSLSDWGSLSGGGGGFSGGFSGGGGGFSGGGSGGGGGGVW